MQAQSQKVKVNQMCRFKASQVSPVPVGVLNVRAGAEKNIGSLFEGGRIGTKYIEN